MKRIKRQRQSPSRRFSRQSSSTAKVYRGAPFTSSRFLGLLCEGNPGDMFELSTLLLLAALVPAVSLQTTAGPVIDAGNNEFAVKKSYQYCWTRWFDRDNPSGSGDYETLSLLKLKYKGKICPKPVDIQARTWSGKTPSQAGDKVKMNVVHGFSCKNSQQKDKKCNDYRVRLSCPLKYCRSDVCWTKWFDRDNPSGTGDWESLPHLRKENPGQICKKPQRIQVVTVKGHKPAASTGQSSLFLYFNPHNGFVCKNKGKKKCLDYKVRFGCCC